MIAPSCLFLAAALTLFLAMTSSAPEQPPKGDPPRAQHSLEEFKQAPNQRLVCGVQSGQQEAAIREARSLGLAVVYIQPGKWFVCQWQKGNMTQKKIDDLRKQPSIRYVVPTVKTKIGVSPGLKVANRQEPFRARQEEVTDDMFKTFLRSESLICGWKPNQKNAATKELEALGLRVVLSDSKMLVCQWNPRTFNKSILARARQLPSVRYLIPSVHTTLTQPAQEERLPNDPDVEMLWGMRSCRATEAWDNITTSPAIVAVLDTGVDYNHEDLHENMWRKPGSTKPFEGSDFSHFEPNFTRFDPRIGIGADHPMDEVGHGTEVAGIIGAVGNNCTGGTGICWRAHIMPVKWVNRNSEGEAWQAAAGLEYAVNNGAKIVNCSWAFLQEDGDKLLCLTARCAKMIKLF